MSTGKNAGMIMEPGAMALWHGRLVEIHELTEDGHVLITFSDEGGLVWNYELASSRPLKLLADQEVIGTLDALQQAAAPNLSVDEQLHRMAELWFAAPEVGDMFENPGDLRVKVLYGTSGGELHTGVDTYSDRFRSWGSSEVSWPSAKDFRNAYRYHDRPGYILRAGATERADFVDHPLLWRPRF
jgi:hypothetical protein